MTTLAAGCGRTHPRVAPANVGCAPIDSATVAELRAMADTVRLAEPPDAVVDTAKVAELRRMLADTTLTAELRRLVADTAWLAEMRPRIAEVEADAARLSRCLRR